ncbi:MAG: UvrD-helicase domain-containing protein, partial [Nocardioidaceae bacterium]
MIPFDVRAALPGAGTTLLEASAGTGKTWTIGALVTRYVVERGVPLEQMLVVTFGRMASQELRARVRAQLVAAERSLSAGTPPDDEFLRWLVDVSSAERVRRLGLVREALTSFDAATIATIHQFCQLVLRGLGVAGDTDARAELVEELDDLVVEVVDDLYLRTFSTMDPPPFSRADALDVGRQAAGDPRAVLEPTGMATSTTAGLRVRFGLDVRDELDRRKRRQGVLSYDDLLGQVADALVDDDSPARTRMRQRWGVVLVDEFQDTDPVQWQVFDRAFTGHATMVLIGDPKQAIYGFRGGDVTTYLAAKRGAGTHATLATNWRSDERLLDALQSVLLGAQLGDPEIAVHPVNAAHLETRLAGHPVDAPFRLRVVRRDHLPLRHDGLIRVAELREHLATDAAHDIKRLLTSGATFDGEPLTAGQVAVLSGTNRQGLLVRDALAAVGVPSVVAGNGSVFATPAATAWLTLLEAMEQPHRTARVRAAALTPFLGRTAAEIGADLGEAVTEEIGETVRGLADVFQRRGAAAVFETTVYAHGLAARVLGGVNGERELTDLRHVAESLHAETNRHRLGLVALAAWLQEQMSDERVELASERTRRLDSDAAAVQIATVHGSKGLEYPVVYLPFVSDRSMTAVPRTVRFHTGDGQRALDLGGQRDDPTWSANVSSAKDEDAGEALRLLYVAMTRAQSQLVAWWAPGGNVKASGLHRLLLGRGSDEGLVPDLTPVPTDESAWTRLGAWVGPVVEESRVEPVSDERLARPLPDLEVRSFDREIDARWRRTSYSALTSAAHENRRAATVGSEPEAPPRDDEELPPRVSGSTTETGTIEPVPSPMAELPVGATFGSLVHAILEHADPSAADLREELSARVDEQLLRWPVDLGRGRLADALVAVCDSPLGPLADNATLRSIPRGDRMCEL